MRKPSAKTIWAICLALIVLGLLCSQPLALLFNGFSVWGNRTITEYTDRDGIERKALLTSDDGSPALVLLERVFPGIWVLRDSDRSDEPLLPGWTQMAWISQGSSRWHESNSLTSGHEWHFVYACNNAKGILNLDQTLLPKGAAVDIWQQGEEYYIHIITYSDGLHFNIYEVLLEAGLITDLQQAS